MASFGINRLTGQPLSGFAHVVQSLGVIFQTRIGSRVLKRTFGSEVPALLGRNIAPSTFLRFAAAVHIAIQLWEPRFKLTQVTFPQERDGNGNVVGSNSQANLRAGRVGVALYGQYLPNGHLGDPTPEGDLQTLQF